MHQYNVIYIFDVDGVRSVIDTSSQPGTSVENIAEFDELVASIRFEPVAPGQSPMTSPLPPAPS
jgi:hypothetical protein